MYSWGTLNKIIIGGGVGGKFYIFMLYRYGRKTVYRAYVNGRQISAPPPSIQNPEYAMYPIHNKSLLFF